MAQVGLRVGVIGLGMIGGAIATSLAQQGMPLAVFDVRDGLADALEGVPPQCNSPREVARCCDVVIVAVMNAQQAEDVLIGADGLLVDGRPGMLVLLVSTVSVDAVHNLARLCREQHAVLVDAGVTSGGGQSAPDGLALMVGGPDDVVERAMPVLNGFARSVIHCGALGTGMAAKLARNAAQYGRWVVLQEAAALAAAAGVSPAVFLRVMEEGADGRDESLTWLRAHRSGVQLSEDQIAGFDAMARKDLAAAQDLAAHLGVEVALTNLTPPRIAAVIRGNTAEPLPDNGFDRGVAMMHTVMGACVADVIRHAPRLPLLRSTVEHLFADIWSRPGLTIRDRRLLVLGATAMLGRTDLLHNQLKGALIAGELTTAQLRELSVFLHYYAGWGNGTAVNTVVENLITNGYGNDDPPAVPGVGG